MEKDADQKANLAADQYGDQDAVHAADLVTNIMDKIEDKIFAERKTMMIDDDTAYTTMTKK